MAKLAKIIKKDAKKARKGAKKLSKQMFSEKGMMLSRSYESTTSIYTGGKDKKPLITVTAQGDYKISVVKLIVILMCVFSTAALVILLAKSIIDHCKVRKNDEEEYIDAWECDDELPF